MAEGRDPATLLQVCNQEAALRLLPAGRLTLPWSEHLDRLAGLLDQLRPGGGTVLAVAPGASVRAQAWLVASSSDEVLLVAGRRTSLDAVQGLKDRLQRLGRRFVAALVVAGPGLQESWTFRPATAPADVTQPVPALRPAPPPEPEPIPEPIPEPELAATGTDPFPWLARPERTEP